MSPLALSSGFGPDLTHVLQIGAGLGLDWPGWLAAGARQITLVEADPERAADLRAATVGHPEVEVIEAPVSLGQTPRPYFRASLPELSSFRAPTALKTLFPGLDISIEENTRPANPVTLTREATSDTAGAGLLCIEAPGEALDILRMVAEAGLLTRFGLIRLREGHSPLYEGAPPLNTIAEFLAGVGFETMIEPAPEDPARPWLRARFNPAQLRAAQAETDLTEAVAGAETLRADLETARTEAAAMRAQRDGAQAQTETLRADLETARAEAATLRAERDEAQAQTETLRADLETARAEAETQREDRSRMARAALELKSADLVEIQTRYQALYEENQALTGLLRDLAALLSEPASKPGKSKTSRKTTGKTTRKSKTKGKSGG